MPPTLARLLPVTPRACRHTHTLTGGNLAAAVANGCAADGIKLAGQLLIYPVVDLASESRSYSEFATGFGLTRDSMRFFVSAYVPNAADRLDPRASPLRNPSLKGVAPAFVLLAGCDVLRDEGRAYAERLKAAGVDTTLIEVRGAIHAFFTLGGLREARVSTEAAASWLAAHR